MAGVGGLGIGVVSRVLTEAAAAAFPEVDTYHKKGLAQRGGGVFCEMVMHDGERIRTPLIADGCADLILGLEGAEGVRACAKGSTDRTAAVINAAMLPTTTVLMGQAHMPDDIAGDTADAPEARRSAARSTLPARVRTSLGDRIFANISMLGAA